MHELSICQSMLRVVEATLRDHPGTKLLRVYVDVGRASTVEPLLLRDAFEIATTGGPYEGTELVINEIPFVGRCRSCEKTFGYQELALGCPNCGSTSVEIESGLELNIKEIEVDE